MHRLTAPTNPNTAPTKTGEVQLVAEETPDGITVANTQKLCIVGLSEPDDTLFDDLINAANELMGRHEDRVKEIIKKMPPAAFRIDILDESLRRKSLPIIGCSAYSREESDTVVGPSSYVRVGNRFVRVDWEKEPNLRQVSEAKQIINEHAARLKILAETFELHPDDYEPLELPIPIKMTKEELFARQVLQEHENGSSTHPLPRKRENMDIKRFRVALSFSGEHRDFVADVAEHLSAQVGRDRVLYDKYYEAEFARLNLDVYLPRLYREESELVVVFLCPEYQAKRWCKLEWRHIRQLITTADEERIMLTSFGSPGDLSEIGILSGDGYVNIGSRDSATIANLILQRANATPHHSTNSAAIAPPSVPSQPHPAVALWREKLDMLLLDEAKAVTTDMKFKIQQDVKEARAKIKELGGQP